jgi:hypothetical protein
MMGEFVPGITDGGGLSGERLDGMPGHKKRRLDVVAIEERQDAWYADAGTIFAALEHVE